MNVKNKDLKTFYRPSIRASLIREPLFCRVHAGGISILSTSRIFFVHQSASMSWGALRRRARAHSSCILLAQRIASLLATPSPRCH